MNAAAQDNRPPRRVVVCVDDFGLNRRVDDSVIALAQQGRISATGCLVDAPAWQEDAPRLQRECAGLIDIGLHLNLSEAFAGAPSPLPWNQLVLRAYAGALDPNAVRAEIARQLDRFEQTLGRRPDFVDGHRHVHQLPIVRRALVDLLAERHAGARPWLRSCAAPARSPGLPAGERFKAQVIAALGSRGLNRLARRAGFAQNRHLLGVYGFEGTVAEQQARLSAWLRCAEDGDLLMCHTAWPAAADPTDPIAPARAVEHQALAGEAFGRQLAEAGLRITRGSALA